MDILDDIQVISTHAPRTGGDPTYISRRGKSTNISTHAPRTGGDVYITLTTKQTENISTHAPRTGGDWDYPAFPGMTGDFNPRPPHRGRPGHAVRRKAAILISTHAPRTGGDGHGGTSF